MYSSFQRPDRSHADPWAGPWTFHLIRSANFGTHLTHRRFLSFLIVADAHNRPDGREIRVWIPTRGVRSPGFLVYNVQLCMYHVTEIRAWIRPTPRNPGRKMYARRFEPHSPRTGNGLQAICHAGREVWEIWRGEAGHDDAAE